MWNDHFGTKDDDGQRHAPCSAACYAVGEGSEQTNVAELRPTKIFYSAPRIRGIFRSKQRELMTRVDMRSAVCCSARCGQAKINRVQTLEVLVDSQFHMFRKFSLPSENANDCELRAQAACTGAHHRPSTSWC
jgi:hypothetical protein